MLFCNPNAGFYEFAFYQSEWFEFYMRMGVNLMLWNYPGYGRTPGSPSMRKALKGGEAIISYLRTVKNSKILGVHGESLGGCIATYLATKCSLNFLFADRTFSSLSSAALHNFGRIAYCGLKIAGAEDTDSAKNYLEAKCYKVISCDPTDTMISDLASLKVGVARGLLSPGTHASHILLPEHMKAFYLSLVRIQGLISKLSGFNNLPNENAGTAPVSTYQPLNDDSELFEVEGFRNGLLKLKNILNGIDAGGLPLMQCLKAKRPEEALLAWVMVLDLWGTPVHSLRISQLQYAVELLKVIVKELTVLMNIQGIKTEIVAVHLALDAVKTHIEARIDNSDSKSLGASQEFKNGIEHENAGFLIPISCGHGGPFSTQEKMIYEQHLLKSRFINYSY